MVKDVDELLAKLKKEAKVLWFNTWFYRIYIIILLKLNSNFTKNFVTIFFFLVYFF